MKKKQFVAVAMAVSLSATSVSPALAADTTSATVQEYTDNSENLEKTNSVEGTEGDSESTEVTSDTSDTMVEKEEVSELQESEMQSETVGQQNGISTEQNEIPAEPNETADNISARLFSQSGAESKTIGNHFDTGYVEYVVTDENEVYVTGFDSYLVQLPEEERNVTVPSTVDWEGVTYNVRGIEAESGSKWVETIVIEEGVTDIHYTAFDSMANLKSLEIKDPNANLKSEDNIVFTQDGTEIIFYTPYKTETTYTIPDTVTCVNASFVGVQYLKEIIVPDSVTKIAAGCLSHMTSVEKLTMSKNTAELGQSAIRGNENLKELIVQGEFRTGFYCFSDMPNLEKIIINSNSFTMTTGSFYNMPKLKEYVVDPSCTNFKAVDGVLYNYDRLLRYPAGKEDTTYVVPEDTYDIAQQAFAYTQNLKTLIFNPGVGLRNATVCNSAISMDIYLRDSEEVNLLGNWVFQGMPDGCHVYGKNQTIVKQLSSGNYVEDNITVEEKTIPATNLSVSRSEIDLNKGNSATVTATMEPYYATDEIKWSSANTKIAIVNNGVITAVGSGNTTITVTAGSKTQTITVKVKAPLQSIALNENSMTLERNKSETLTVAFNPTDTTDNKNITWSSSDKNIATVDNNGKVTAVKGGSCTITAKVGSKTATCAVTVKKIIVSGVSLDKTTLNLEKGKTAALKATYAPANAEEGTNLTYQSSNTKVASVDNQGNVKAVGGGTATITVKSGNGKTATCAVTVNVSVTKIALSETSKEIVRGESAVLNATITPSDATNKAITWSTSNAKVATVDKNGRVTGVANGTATITAKADGKSDTCKVTVKDRVITGVTVSPESKTLAKGENFKVSAVVAPSNTTLSKALTWTSSNVSVATVDKNGNVTAVNEGTSTITGKTVNGKTDTCKITVKKRDYTISLNKTSADVMIGLSEKLSVTFSHTPENDSVTWTTTDADTVSVSSDGTIKANNFGQVTITATAKNGKTATCIVTVPSQDIPYSDISKGAWYYRYVASAYNTKIMTGYSDGRFGPSDNVTRGQFATIMYRQAGSPDIPFEWGIYGDVGDHSFFSIPAIWGHNTGVMSGYSNGNFGPNDNITREQVATILYRYAGAPAVDESVLNQYPDANKVSSFARKAIAWSIEQGIISGDGGNINPYGNASRAVCATILTRYQNK